MPSDRLSFSGLPAWWMGEAGEKFDGYTSFNQSIDSALIWAYGPDAQAIAVGSTTGPT